jgi:O-antigen/teichoic acid export membrane protein
MKKNFLKYQAILFPVLDIALNGANYLFHVYITWYLIPSDYGILNALLSFSTLLLVTGVSFQLYTAKFIAEENSLGGRGLNLKITGIKKNASLIAGIVSLVYLMLIVPIHNLTRGSYSSILLILIIFILNLFLSINRGVIQGVKVFIHLNISFYIEVGFKIMLVIILLPHFTNINGVLISIVIGMLFSLIHSIIFVGTLNKSAAGEVVEKENFNHLVKIIFIFGANFFTYFFTSLDSLLVNYFLPDVSGYFAVVLKYTQILLFGSLSVTTVFVPILSDVKKDKEEFLKKIKILLFLIVLIIVSVAILYYFLASSTVDMFFGKQYDKAKEYILIDCIPYDLLIMNFVIINIHIIFDNKKYLWVLVTYSILLITLLLRYHGSLIQILGIETLVYAAMFISQLLILLRNNHFQNEHCRRHKNVQ